MITEAKLKIYRRYKGNIDAWARGGSKKEKLAMTDEDWYVIGGILQDLSLVRKRLASLSFSENLSTKLKEICDSDSTINELHKLTPI